MKPVGKSGVRPASTPTKKTTVIAVVAIRCFRHQSASRM